jgi:hypothetical protein
MNFCLQKNIAQAINTGMKIIFIPLLLCVFCTTKTLAQEPSLEEQEPKPFISDKEADAPPPVVVKRHSPKKAAMLSAIAPGAGQIYNRKYWKLPLVYGGIGGLGYWVGLNIKNLNGYSNAYRLQVDGDSTTFGSYKGISDTNALKLKRNEVKSSLDLSIILMVVAYAINVVDATVDAHLFDYDVNEDITISLKPNFNLMMASNGYSMIPTAGLSFKMNFK